MPTGRLSRALKGLREHVWPSGIGAAGVVLWHLFYGPAWFKPPPPSEVRGSTGVYKIKARRPPNFSNVAYYDLCDTHLKRFEKFARAGNRRRAENCCRLELEKACGIKVEEIYKRL